MRGMVLHVIAAAAVGAGLSAAQAPATTQSVSPEVRQQQVRAYSSYGAEGGLRAAAAITGYFELPLAACGEDPVKTLEHLVQFSDNIVVGKIGPNAARLASRLTIVTDYEVPVERSLKGDVAKGSTVDVSILGGAVTFPDGNVARVSTPDAFMPEPGHRYLLFLRKPLEVQRAYDEGARSQASRRVNLYLVSGCQGEYPVGADGRMIAFNLADQSTTLAREIAGKREAAIVSTVLKLAAK
jgi:hypothetical protein